MKISRIIFIFLVLNLLLGVKVFSQPAVQYAYDLSGNRTQRQIIVCVGCQKVTQAQATTDTTRPDPQVVKLAMKEGISVFPNPTQDKVVVSISTFNEGEPTKLHVLDASGKTIQTLEVKGVETPLDFANLKQGIYYVRVVKGKDQLVYKIIKLQ